jgi:hypothetical protein
MIGLLHFTTLVITTVFAAGAAALVNWLLLRATFQLMRPATLGQSRSARSTQRATRLSLVPGTTRVAQAYAGRR